MTTAIRYFTRSGNTEKLAHAIEKQLNITAHDISVPLESKADILFLGCSYYAFDMDEAVKKFISDNKENIGAIACFGTSAMMKSMKKPMKRLTDLNGITLLDKEFHCRGEFKFANKGRPNNDDLNAVANFAREAVDSYGK